MAQIVGVFQTSHSPFCYRRPEAWNDLRRARPIRADVPLDDLETNRKKYARVQAGFATLKRKVAEAGPDVIVIFGDDQMECFDFSNFPAFSIYLGGEFEGTVVDEDAPLATEKPIKPLERARVRGHPPLATALLTGLMKHGFDPAFSMSMPKPEEGIGHAIMRPVQSLTDFGTPVVPFLMNCYYAPQPTAQRCYQLGSAVRAIVEDFPDGLRVALIGSGGLWHTPSRPGAWLDEAFDETLLAHMKKGDVRAMAAHFDGYKVPAGDASQDISVAGRFITGMPALSGPQGGGTRETCNWIAAAGAVEGATATVVDRVPIYASPIDTAFAYFNL
jgi:hypothetical protein